MPSYKKIVIFCFLIQFLIGCNGKINSDIHTEEQKNRDVRIVKTKYFDLENAYIFFALEYENQKAFKQAKDIYLKLFENTNNYEYFVKYLSISFMLKDYNDIKQIVSKNDIENIKEEELILKIYSFSLLKLNDKKNAIKYANRLVEYYPKEINYELLGSVYMELKEYKDAYLNLRKAYEIGKDVNTLVNLTTILYYHLNQKDLAKKELEDYVDKNGFDYKISIQLLSFYEKEKQNEKIISMLKDMYYYYKQQKNEEFSLTRTKSLLISYLSKKDVYEAIKFLEDNNEEEIFLLNLYRNNSMFVEAYNLLEKLYLKTNDLDYLAQQAIIEFEMAESREMVLDSVISKFSKVVEKLPNPTYENYLAYILIDYNKDVKKGLYLIKKALKSQPNNIAFIDTLAWGEYKMGNCQNAYIQMKKVVDKEGLEDSEIKLHWEKIKECKK